MMLYVVLLKTSRTSAKNVDNNHSAALKLLRGIRMSMYSGVVWHVAGMRQVIWGD